MEIFRKYFVVIILTIIIAIVWGGVLLVSNRTFSTLNPNAETYTKPLNPKFNEDLLNDISERTEDTLAVPPSEFFELDPQD